MFIHPEQNNQKSILGNAALFSKNHSTICQSPRMIGDWFKKEWIGFHKTDINLIPIQWPSNFDLMRRSTEVSCGVSHSRVRFLFMAGWTATWPNPNLLPVDRDHRDSTFSALNLNLLMILMGQSFDLMMGQNGCFFFKYNTVTFALFRCGYCFIIMFSELDLILH